MHNLIHLTDVSDVPNYSNSKRYCGFLLSEPKKYIGTHLLIYAIMGLYYAVCGWRAPLALFIITIVVNVIIQILILALGLRDPGFLPKIFGEY